MDDLWVISSSPMLQQGAGAWCCLARSCWHGPGHDDKFEVELLGPGAPASLPRSQAVFGLRALKAGTEVAMLQALGHFQAAAVASGPQLPLMRALLGGARDGATSPAPPLDTSPGIAALAAEVTTRFQLNEEQQEVLGHVAAWFLPGGVSKPLPVCLVHGPFGSGKSTLLVALIHFLSKARQAQQPGSKGVPSPLRVLVSAHTNCAVDRVLCELARSGFSDLLRVGALRRIDRRLLPYSLHCVEAKGGKDAAKELTAMLAESTDPAEQSLIRQELEEARRGSDKERRKRLGSACVVGVTCCSSGLPQLDRQKFDVLLLDECSQMVEPLSLLPLLRSQAAYLIAAGDPLQLPPVVAAPAEVTAGGASLVRPLFVRLTGAGVRSHLLRRQYRCHPDLSALPNELYYGGRLLDGCSREQRQPVVPGLPALSFVEVREGQEQFDQGRSCYNEREARVAVRVARWLLDIAGVPPGQVGIICFFRAHAACVLRCLQQQGVAAARPAVEGREDGGGGRRQEEAGGVLQVATVDSFQGSEKEVIILTSAVTRPGSFVSDPCRLNVALTRARRHVIAVGNPAALSESSPAFERLLRR